jgi:restriction endonuclease S subunit
MAAYYPGEPGLFLYPDLMIKVRLSEKVSLRYVHLCAVAPHARAYFSTHASGAQATMPKINQGVLVKLPIPLAPLAEQNRIVAKVAELMALCDQLEAQLTTTQSEKRSLLEAVLSMPSTIASLRLAKGLPFKLDLFESPVRNAIGVYGRICCPWQRRSECHFGPDSKDVRFTPTIVVLATTRNRP